MGTNFQCDYTINDKINQQDVELKPGDKPLGPRRLIYRYNESSGILTKEVRHLCFVLDANQHHVSSKRTLYDTMLLSAKYSCAIPQYTMITRVMELLNSMARCLGKLFTFPISG